MLARANRVTRPVDFRTAVRRGRRVGTSGAVLHVLPQATVDAPRFGFIVGKTVGNSVTRNLVRRRLRALSAELIGRVPQGTDVVMRALPGSGELAWVTLHSEITEGVERAMGA